ncbi:glycosyltransferase family 2 protein [Aequorivita viscosa]|uniref:Glycosyltransferase involved in cell wall bisynthesis n=1 Tax=Aequorivita viscosa TaxID=797419 RepID=A0A1M6GIH8_9FLAO|nr:glycosyltransferase family 2 protein [Aequorivita viscosa]SDW84109.1 Glycosyltransferase involved in cell wall bisynthesis [Aequorivita viscosa]SHJ09739.1 Glycosyltransferase involved in cell wall bisynthesis [Aequorivita viscosa]
MTNQNPLVSIIIPTFNRAHLIGETLDSVLAQTYQNWECIVVDDGSTDDTEEVVQKYLKLDKRFKFYLRPNTHSPGGNGARNYGFKMCQGDYVIWFDSDDLMLPEKLQLQLDALIGSEYDFSVAKHGNFYTKSPNLKKQVKKFDKNICSEVSLLNYSIDKNYWGTIDLLGRRSILDNQRFNEQLKSGQEYNFFVSIVACHGNIKGIYLDQDLALRRIHNSSIQSIQNFNQKILLANKFQVYQETFFDNVERLNDELKNHLLWKMTLLFHNQVIIGSNQIKIIEFVSSLNPYLDTRQVVILYFVLVLSKITKRGYSLGKRVLKIVF